MTTLGFNKDGWIKLSDWLKKCVDICISRQNKFGKKIKEWEKDIENDSDILKIKEEIILFLSNYIKGNCNIHQKDSF